MALEKKQIIAKAKELKMPLTDRKRRWQIVKFQRLYKKKLNKTDVQVPLRSLLFEEQFKDAQNNVRAILKLDPKDVCELSVESYINDFESIERLRVLSNDTQWLNYNPDVAAALFPNEEVLQLFCQYLLNLSRVLNQLKEKADILFDEASLVVNTDKMDLGLYAQLEEAFPSLEKFIKMGREIIAYNIEADELVKHVINLRKSIDTTGTQLWIDVLKKNPVATETEQIIYSDVTKIPLSMCKEAVEKFKAAFLTINENQDMADLTEEYRASIRKVVKSLLAQMDNNVIAISDEDRILLNAMADGASISKIRELAISPARQACVHNPSLTNIKTYLSQYQSVINEMVEHPKFEYGYSEKSIDINERALDQLLHACVYEVCGILNITKEQIKRQKGNNAEVLHYAAEVDAEDYQRRMELASLMFEYAKLPEVDIEKQKEIAESYNLPKRSQDDMHKLLEARQIIKKHLAQYVIDSQKADNTDFISVVNKMSAFDLDMVSDKKTIFDHLENIQAIFDTYALLENSDERFSKIEAAIKSKEFEIDSNRYDSIKAYALAYKNRIVHIMQEFNVCERGLAAVVDINKTSVGQAIEVSTDPRRIGDEYTKAFGESMIEWLLFKDSFKAIADLKETMEDLNSLNGMQYLEKLKSKALESARNTGKLLFFDKHNDKEQKVLNSKLIDDISALAYFDNIEKRFKGSDVNEIKEKLLPKRVATMKDNLKDYVEFIAKNTPKGEFISKVLSDSSDELGEYIRIKLQNLLKTEEVKQ